MYNLKKTFFTAFRLSAPIMFSYVIVGLTFGIMLAQAGYTWLHALISGLFMYSGSLQIALIPMMKAHFPLAVIALSSFLINARYMFYGIGYKERFKKQGWLYPYMVMAFPDEVYGVFSSVRYEDDVDPVRCDRWIAFLCQAAWTGGGVAGTLIGDIRLDLTGIDFAATAMFVCIVADQWRNTKNHIPAIIGGAVGMICLLLIGTDNFMLPALIASLVVLLIFKNRVQEKTEGSGKTKEPDRADPSPEAEGSLREKEQRAAEKQEVDHE